MEADVPNVAFAAERHGDIELPAQNVENARHAGLSASPKAPKKRSSDEGGSRLIRHLSDGELREASITRWNYRCAELPAG